MWGAFGLILLGLGNKPGDYPHARKSEFVTSYTPSAVIKNLESSRRTLTRVPLRPSAERESA